MAEGNIEDKIMKEFKGLHQVNIEPVGQRDITQEIA